MNDQYVDSIRLSQRLQRELLCSIEATRQEVAESNRQHERIEFHTPGLRLEVRHPDGETARFLVCGRNISAGGVSFLHGGFLYPGSRCWITRPTVWSGEATIQGKIVSARHVAKRMHEFGIAFDDLVDRRRFVTLPGEKALEKEPEIRKISSLSGRVLFIDESELQAKLAAFHLKDSGITVITAKSAVEGIVELRSGPIDAVLIDIDTQEEPPAGLISQLREGGCKGPAIAVTTDPDGELAEAAILAGASEILGKPLTANALVRALGESLAPDTVGSGPIRSQLGNNTQATELVDHYVGFVHSLVEELNSSIEHENGDAIRKVCRTIAESAGGYGFPQLEQVARLADMALEESAAINEALTEIQKLLHVCRRIEPVGNG